MEIRILTLNLHCFAEKEIIEKQRRIAEAIISNKIDLVFLQEVAQTRGELINPDNYGLKIVELLKSEGLDYYFYYEGFKRSFDIYEEGLGFISKYPLSSQQTRFISNINDYENWKTRKILECNLDFFGKKIRIATTHFGWSDELEVFEKQFDKATEAFDLNTLTILAGDFNITPKSKEYNYILDRGWLDLSRDNTEFYLEPTFKGDQTTKDSQVRLDYIMANKQLTVISKKILFNGNYVSDHFGLYMILDI